MRRLWIFNHYAGFPETVPATRTFELARLLGGHGWEVTVIAAGFNHYHFVDDWTYPRAGVVERVRDRVRWVFLRTVPYRRNGARRVLNMISYAWRARRWAARQDRRALPDAVIGTTVHPLAADAARVIARRCGAAFLYEITDLWPETLVDLGAIARHSPTHRYLFGRERAAFRSAAGVIGLLPHIPAYAWELHKLRVRRFSYAPNGVVRERVAAVSNRPIEPGRVAWLGGFAVAHGGECIVAAAEVLERRHPGVFRFDLFGDGPERPRLEELAASKGLPGVRFLGWVGKEDIGTTLASAEMCLCTARPLRVHRYGVSMNKLFDYFAAAKPVVYAVDSGNDPVREAGAGLTVSAGDAAAIAEAIEAIHALDAAQRRAMGERGRAFLLEHHVFDVIAERLAAFLEEAVASAAVAR